MFREEKKEILTKRDLKRRKNSKYLNVKFLSQRFHCKAVSLKFPYHYTHDSAQRNHFLKKNKAKAL